LDTFKNIDEIVDGGITTECNISTINTILAQDSLDFFRGKMCQWNCIRHIDTTLFLSFEGDIRGFLVESDSESLEFSFDYSFVSKRFVNVEDDENKIACPSNCDDLTTSSLNVNPLMEGVIPCRPLLPQ
jgi:hypothetical protein